MQDEMFEENPGLDGPDYVALVIEWDELENEVTGVYQPIPEPPRRTRSPRAIRALVVAGVLAAFGLVAWGFRRLRAA